ncbi:MAG: pilin [Parcubacteria group bacterium]|jgi:hypothetical protein
MTKAKNKIFLKTLFLSCLLVFSFSIVSSAFAEALVPCGIGEGNADCTLCHLILGFQNIYNYLLALILSATTLVVVVAGVMYMVSSGNKGMIEKAKSALSYALTAMVLALVAWLIINATLSALGFKHPFSGKWYEFTCDTTQTTSTSTGTGTGTNTNTNTNTGTSTGCAAVASHVKAMEGWTYTTDTSLRMKDGYGDCSSTTERAFTRAGCSSPGGSTSAMAAGASAFTGASSLKAGDALVWNNGLPGKDSKGHVGICLNDGCTQIMGASTKYGIHASGGGSASISAQAAKNGSTLKVIKASDHCPASSC